MEWLARPARHDYAAAEDYLSLVMDPAAARAARDALAAAGQDGDLTARKAKDILRASELPLLPAGNKHVAADLAKAAAGEALSPVLLIRGSRRRPLIIADGYHRVCASYWTDENTGIPCVLI